MKPTLTSLKMFKYLVFRGLEDILKIFNASKAEDPAVVKACLKKANRDAATVWNDRDIPFAVRVEKCRKIFDPVLKMNDISGGVGFIGLSPLVARKLDKIFRKYYKEPRPPKVLLIGQTSEEAYEVQEKYARTVAHLLAEESKNFESRAMTQLNKMYGRNSIPLLTMASVYELWQLCRSPFYRRVTSLVSPFCSAYRLPY